MFYKDQKSSVQKQGSPYGKPEAVVSLVGARVDLNPKELTSKKNTILVSLVLSLKMYSVLGNSRAGRLNHDFCVVYIFCVSWVKTIRLVKSSGKYTWQDICQKTSNIAMGPISLWCT